MLYTFKISHCATYNIQFFKFVKHTSKEPTVKKAKMTKKEKSR